MHGVFMVVLESSEAATFDIDLILVLVATIYVCVIHGPR